MSCTLVLGGFGTVGFPLIRSLLSRGNEVSVLSRNPKARSLLPEGVNVFHGDLIHQNQIESAIKVHQRLLPRTR